MLKLLAVTGAGALAWTYNQFNRTQLAGMQAGGTVAPVDTQSLFLVPRIGVTARAGIEVAILAA